MTDDTRVFEIRTHMSEDAHKLAERAFVSGKKSYWVDGKQVTASEYWRLLEQHRKDHP